MRGRERGREKERKGESEGGERGREGGRERVPIWRALLLGRSGACIIMILWLFIHSFMAFLGM